MTSLPASCVVDASVGIRLFPQHDRSEDVQALFRESLGGAQNPLFVPDLFFIECTNILWKMVRLTGYPEEQAKAHLADLVALEVPSVPTSELMQRALEIACLREITAYEACCVALSEAMGVPLRTADDRLASKLAGSSFSVVTLAGTGEDVDA